MEPEDALEQLFTELIDRQELETCGCNARQIIQLQGQAVESLELLKDVVDELREIDPQAIATIKSITLRIFDLEAG